MESHHFQTGHLHAMTRRLFMAAGAPRHIADNVAEILVKANLTGHDSHGVLRIPAYMNAIENGSIRPAAEPAVTKETPNTVLLDGQNGFGHHTARVGMNLAIEKAKQADLCCVSFVRTGHIGRLGEYAEAAARAGCIGLITIGGGRPGKGSVVPFGGAKGVMGTNPIALGVPTGDGVPFVLDIATSVVAEGKLQVARSKNADVPEGYIVDKEGRPTTRTLDFYDGGFLLPFGRHKGYGLSLFVALLGGLSGNFDLEAATVSGEFMLALNVETLTSLESYQQGVRTFLDEVKATPPAPGFTEVLVPGDFEQRSLRQRLVAGIELPATIVGQIQEWADKLDVSLDEEGVEAADQERYQ